MMVIIKDKLDFCSVHTGSVQGPGFKSQQKATVGKKKIMAQNVRIYSFFKKMCPTKCN